MVTYNYAVSRNALLTSLTLVRPLRVVLIVATAVFASGALLFAVFSFQSRLVAWRHSRLEKNAVIAGARIVAKQNLDGDPCGGARLRVGFVDESGRARVASVLQQCTGDDHPGQVVQIRYDRLAPSHAELASDPETYSTGDEHFELVVMAVLALLAVVAGSFARRAGMPNDRLGGTRVIRRV